MEWSYICYYACFLPYSHSGHFLQFPKCTEAISCKYLPKHFLNSFQHWQRKHMKIKWTLMKSYQKKIEIKRLVCGYRWNFFLFHLQFCYKNFSSGFMWCRHCALSIEHIKENTYRLAVDFCCCLVLFFDRIKLYF